MSHRATFWLSELELKDVSGGAFKVLFHLCNAHNSHRAPDRACFPSQELLMAKTGLSNGGLNNCINQLEKAGILTRLKGTAPETRERRTYYILGCDAPEAQQTPESGVSLNDEQTPLSEVTNSTFEGNKLHSSGDYPVKEPVKEPVSKKINKKDFDISLLSQAFEYFNETADRVGWPKAQLLNQTRKTSLKARMSDAGGLDGWIVAVDKAAAAPHLIGQNDRGWKATLDWILKPANFTKIMEGNYDQTIGERSTNDNTGTSIAALVARRRSEAAHQA